ncbi:MAG TPA: Hsp70 family protein [Trebonia sp.]|jgi:actin-like ATPase involved in cell morphogenesis
MSYGLGVDLGTTFTAAAVARDGRVEMATLGDHTDAVPSVVLVREDGTVLTGGAAERRAAAEPDRVARSVKRRFGDPVPVILGGTPYTATALIAHQLRAVVNLVSDREGGPPGVVTLTHPANWGPYKRELFAQVPELAGLGEVRMLTEPEAAAAHYARNDHLDPGTLVAVYDLGGGTFDATVLRTTEHGFDILGRPEGIEGLGGIDFDEAVFTHVDQALGGAVARLDPADPRAVSAATRLRHECVTAKEALSADTETTIPVLLPEMQTEVRLTRGEFEKMIRPAIDATIASLRRALESARVDLPKLHTVLLVGGSSRIPMVAHLVSAELGRPTSVDTHPKHAIALGAAAVGADTAGAGAAAAVAAAPVRLTPTAADKAGAAKALAPTLRMAAAGAPAPAAAPALADPDHDRHRRQRRRRLLVVSGVLVAALAAGTAATSALSNPPPTTSHPPTHPAVHRSHTTGGSGRTDGRSGATTAPTTTPTTPTPTTTSPTPTPTTTSPTPTPTTTTPTPTPTTTTPTPTPTTTSPTPTPTTTSPTPLSTATAEPASSSGP